MQQKIYKLFLIPFLVLPVIAFGQTSGGQTLLGLDVKDNISIFSSEKKEKVIARMGHDFSNEDFLLINILDAKGEMYFVNAMHAVAGDSAKGWISRKEKLVVYNKKSDTLVKLYKLPSPVTAVNEVTYLPGEFTVTGYSKGWLKVVVNTSTSKATGWLAPEDQWNNPYTTNN